MTHLVQSLEVVACGPEDINQQAAHVTQQAVAASCAGVLHEDGDIHRDQPMQSLLTAPALSRVENEERARALSMNNGSPQLDQQHPQPSSLTSATAAVHTSQEQTSSRLAFPTDTARSTLDPNTALKALGEGQACCAVTGDAFEHLLQCGYVSVLEAVMRNAVVFARMQPHQKGQVTDLLTIRGLYQMYNGQACHIKVRHQCTIVCMLTNLSLQSRGPARVTQNFSSHCLEHCKARKRLLC